MPKPEIFRFRDFNIQHSASTMKVGQDAVLLGALTKIENAGKILDIGTGCGIIALMLAQRSNADIDAIEIDENSATEAASNFQLSPWSDRLHAIHLSLADFVTISTQKYDLIVSNPPFFHRDLLPVSKKLQMAKHATSLDFDSFIKGSKALLKKTGRLNVILPCTLMEVFTSKCLINGLFQLSAIQIIPRTGRKPNRVILTFSDEKAENIISSFFTVRNENGHYSQQYIDATAGFHPPQYFTNQV